MPFFKPPVSFSLNITSTFSVMMHNSSVIFSSTLYTLDKKKTLKVQILRFVSALVNFTRALFWGFKVLGQNLSNSSRCFSKYLSVSIQILHHSLVLQHITSLYFFWLKHDIFLTKVEHWSANFRLATVRIKIHEIPHIILEPRVRFSSNLASLYSVMRCITLLYFFI